jgi:3-phosphoshikimate 1-carboxyvinyltransferase
MSDLVVRAGELLRGQIRLPGDKSISHRALLLGALAEGSTHIQGFLPSEDCHATLACLRALGVEIEVLPGASAAGLAMPGVTVHGRGLDGLRAPVKPLNCVRSGTTMRLLAGILAGQSFESVLTGEPQLLRRPMRRITEPLRLMGAEIEGHDGHGPLTIQGRDLHGYDHALKIASAQVKSALLLAGLYADGVTTVRQPGPARDHTERMLVAMGADIQVDGLDVSLGNVGGCRLQSIDVDIPGDISSAAFPLVAALIAPDAQITLEAVGVNPTRTGLLDVLEAMGADLTFRFKERAARLGQETFGEQERVRLGQETFGEQERVRLGQETFGERERVRLGQETFGERERVRFGQETFGERENEFEPRADIRVQSSTLIGVEVGGETIVRMIDEFPILAVAATQAQGMTLVRDAAELRVKETDRIATVVEGLRGLGAEIEARPDGFVVQGPTPLRGAVVNSYGDHRVAMALAIAGLVAEGETVIEDAACIRDSFPGFVTMMQSLGVSCDYVER